jgi:hypothetical protein
VTTATVERIFSIMNFVKNQLRVHKGDEFFNGCLVIYMKSDILFDSGKNEKYQLKHIQNIYKVTH